MHRPRNSTLLFFLSLLLASNFLVPVAAYCKDQSKFQLFLRTGNIQGEYNGVFKGKFEVNLLIDVGAEYYTSAKGSVFLRFLQAMDSPDSVPYYTYSGFGVRQYFIGRGSYHEQSDDTTFISARPKIRAYYAGEIGVAQVIVKTFGPVIQSISNMLEVGANVGAVYQITDDWGLEAQFGGTLGYGISSTSTNGSTIRYLFGVTRYF